MFQVRRRAVVSALVASALAASFGVDLTSPTASAAPTAALTELVGTFRITPGACGTGATGSTFRMILPTGTATGPFIENADSTCADKTFTLLSPGLDGGLVTGSYQPAPSPGFDGKGNSLAVRVIRPVRFFGVDFSASTNPKDLQTTKAANAPSLRSDGGRLTGELAAFAATWNKQAFNQGSPKPDGTRPGNTSAVAGTLDATTGSFTLTWASQIVGGPFDNFTGLWHLEGTFVPAADGSPAPTVTPAAQSPTGAATPAADPAAGATAGAPEVTGAPSTTTVGSESAAPAAAMDEAALAAARVEDESFEAPAWLVVALASAGIGGVVALLVLGPRRREAGT